LRDKFEVPCIPAFFDRVKDFTDPNMLILFLKHASFCA